LAWRRFDDETAQQRPSLSLIAGFKKRQQKAIAADRIRKGVRPVTVDVRKQSVRFAGLN